MKRSLYSVKDREVEYAEGRSSNSSSNSSQCAAPSKEQSQRLRQGINTGDLWHKFVKDNWAPVLESAFGADWANKYPEEVTAILWWALNYRSRAHVGHAACEVKNSNHTIIGALNSPSDSGALVSVTSCSGDKGSTASSSKFSFGLDQPPEFVIGCSTPTNRSSSKDAFHTPSSLSDPCLHTTSTASFYNDAHCKHSSNTLKFPTPVTSSAGQLDISTLESAHEASHPSMADVGQIMQQIQQELESRIMLCDVSLDMGVNGEMDLPELSPHELLERSGLAALLPVPGQLPNTSSTPELQTTLPTDSSLNTFSTDPYDAQSSSSQPEASVPPHLVLIPTAPTLDLQQLAISLSSSLSLMQDSSSDLALQYSPTAAMATPATARMHAASSSQAAIPQGSEPTRHTPTSDSLDTSFTDGSGTTPAPIGPCTISARTGENATSNNYIVSAPQPCAESAIPQEEQSSSSRSPSTCNSSPMHPSSLPSNPLSAQEAPRVPAPSAATFPSVSSLPNPFAPTSLTPPHSLFLNTPTSSTASYQAAPTPFTSTPSSTQLPAYSTPIFASLNLSSSSPTASAAHHSLNPSPSADHSFTTLPPASTTPGFSTTQPSTSGLPQFGLYLPTMQSSTQQRVGDGPSTAAGMSLPGSAGHLSSNTGIMLPTQAAGLPSTSISGTSGTSTGLPMASQGLCNMLCAMGNALALQYVPVQLVAAGGTQQGLAGVVPSASSPATTPPPPVYLMDSLVSGHTFQSIVDGVDSMGRAPLHVAAAAGRADVVEQLMYVGCDCSKALQADFPLDQKLSHAGLVRLSDIHSALHTGEPIRGVVPGYEQPPSFVGCTALHLAAYFGNLEVVDLLLKAPGVDVKATSDCGMTALHMAANQGHAHVLSRLCKVPGAEVDAVDIMGCTALHHAAALGHAAVLDQLWPRGADLEALDPELRTPLHLAAQAGHTDVVSKLVIAGCHVQKYNKDGLTAGHLAAMYGYADVLEKLLLAGYEVDCPAGPALIPGIIGATPLHLSAAAGHVNVLSLLLSNGASVAKQDARGATALHCAAEGTQAGAFQMLVQAGSDIHVLDCQAASLLHAAAKGGNCEIIQHLLGLGCDMAASTHSGENVLHYAAKAGAVEACKLLVECGADSTALDAAGNAPWHVAAMEGHDEVLELCLSHGVPLELPTSTGSTALHCAAAGGHLEAVCLLLQKGAVPDAICTQQQQSALHVAARMDRLHVLQLVLRSVQEDAVNVQDVHGCTPLHYAAQKGNVVMLELLLDAGADPNLGSKEGQTPLHLATKQQHLEAVEFLLAHGCVAATCDVHGCNALHYAAQCAHLPLFQLLSQQPGTLVKEKARSGFTLLHYAVEGSCMEAVQMLLDAGVWEVDDCQGLEGHNNSLHMACKLGKLEIVKVLLLAGYSPTARGSEGRQPLHWAAFGSRLVPASGRKGADYYGVLQLLLVSGVDVHAIDEHHCNAVMYAAGSGEVKVLEQLLQLGCNPLLQDMTGWTALHWAATGENGSVIPMLLQLGCPLAAVDQHGRLALHWAAEKGLMPAVTSLVDAMLEAGLDVHMLDASGSSPAQLAACQGHVEVVAKLLETGKTKEVKGLTALHLAAQNGLDQVVAQLLAVAGCDVNVRDGDGLTPLHWAATRGALPVLQQLINGGADINAASNDGWMALHKAASAGHAAVVELLITCGSVINFKTSNGSTPLHYAASNGHTGVVPQLIAAGCPVNSKSSAGCTALYCAASAGHLEATEELLKANAEVDALTTTGCTALHIAASNGHGKVVQRLVAAGADMDVQASNGSCALHNAVQNGHVEVVEVLMAAGCDWDIQNSNGNTALHIAASKGNMDIVNKLLGAGCDVHIRNSKQWQAVHSAANNGYFDVVLRLVQHGAVWKSKGEADVVRMLVRKSSLKISYVEGRLRLAEREKQRLKKAPALVPEHSSGSKPNDDELKQLSQQADANMAALLEEEEARREAQEAAAERRKAKKKSKKKKSTKDASKGTSAPSTEGEAEDADDEQGVSDGRSLADEQQAASACQFDMELGSDTPADYENVMAPSSVNENRAFSSKSREHGADSTKGNDHGAVPSKGNENGAVAFQSNKHGAVPSKGRTNTSADGSTELAQVTSISVNASGTRPGKAPGPAAAAAWNAGSNSSDGEGGDKNVSLMQMIADLRIRNTSPGPYSTTSSASFKPGTSAPGQYTNTRENGTKEQASRSLPAAQARERTKQASNKDKAGSNKAAQDKTPNGHLPPAKAQQKAAVQVKQEPVAAKTQTQSKTPLELQLGRSSAANKVQVNTSKAEVVTTSTAPASSTAGAGRKAAKQPQSRQQQQPSSQAATAAAAVAAAATAVADAKRDKLGSTLTDRPHTAPAAGARSIPAPVSSMHTQRAKADDITVRYVARVMESSSVGGATGSKPQGKGLVSIPSGGSARQASTADAVPPQTTGGKQPLPSMNPPATTSHTASKPQQPSMNPPATTSHTASKPQQPAMNPPATTSHTVSKQSPLTATPSSTVSKQQPPVNPAAVSKQPPPTFQTDNKQQQQPTANNAAATSHSVIKQQLPMSNPAATLSQGLNKQQQPAVLSKQQLATANPAANSKQQPPAGNPVAVSKQQPPAGNPVAVSKQQPPASNSVAVRKQQPPAGNPVAVSKQQPPASNSVAVSKQQPPAGNPVAVSKQQPATASAYPAATSLHTLSKQPTSTSSVVTTPPPVTHNKQQRPAGNPVPAASQTVSKPLPSSTAAPAAAAPRPAHKQQLASANPELTRSSKRHQGAASSAGTRPQPAEDQPGGARSAAEPPTAAPGRATHTHTSSAVAAAVAAATAACSSPGIFPSEDATRHDVGEGTGSGLTSALQGGDAEAMPGASKVRRMGEVAKHPDPPAHAGSAGAGAAGKFAAPASGSNPKAKQAGVSADVRGDAEGTCQSDAVGKARTADVSRSTAVSQPPAPSDKAGPASNDKSLSGQNKVDAVKVASRAGLTPITSSLSTTLPLTTNTSEARGAQGRLMSPSKVPDARAVGTTAENVAKDSSQDVGTTTGDHAGPAMTIPTPASSGGLSASAASFVPSSLSKARAMSSSAESVPIEPPRSSRPETAPQPVPLTHPAPLSYSAAVAPPGTTLTSAFHRPSHLATTSTPLSNSPLTSSALGADQPRTHAPKTAWGNYAAPLSTSAATTTSPRTSSPAPPRPPAALQSQASSRLSTSPSSSPTDSLPHPPLPSVPPPTSALPFVPNSAAALNPWRTGPQLSDMVTGPATVPLSTSWTLPTNLSHPISMGMPARPIHPYLTPSPVSLDWANSMGTVGSVRGAALSNRQPIDWSFAPSVSTGSMFPSSSGAAGATGGQSNPAAPERNDATSSTTAGISASPTHRTAAASSSWQLQSHILRSHSSSGLTGMGLMDSTVSHSLPTAIPSTSIWSFNASSSGSGAFARPAVSAGMIQPVARTLFNERGQVVGSLDAGSGTISKGAVRLSTQVSDQYRCPISKKIMQDPVVAGDGYTYERAAIEEWLEKYDTSPITNGQLVSRELVPNMTMRAAIQLLATQ